MKTNEKVLAKEQKQLAKLRKEQGKSNFKAYPLIALVFMILLRMLDEFTTNCSSSLQTSIVTEFFVKGQGMTFQEGLSAMSLATSPLMLLSILATIIMVLSDRIGRKPMLLASGIGIAAGAVIVFLSPDFSAYMMGCVLINFFISFDMHQLYIVEVAPENKRATWQAYSSFFSQMAIVFVGVTRLLNTNEAGELAWRNIYLLPALVGVIVAILLVVVIRESDVFLKQRIAHLETPLEERQAAGKKVQNNNGGLGKAFGFIFKNKQMLWVMLSLLLFRMAIPAFASYNESIMSQNGMSTDAVSTALIFSPIAMGFTRLSAGFASDKLGRKKASTIYGAATVAVLIAFILCVKNGANPVIVGLLMGISSGSYWTVGDQIGLMMNESAPTAIRGSVTAAAGLLQVVVAIVAMVFAGIMVAFVDPAIFCVVYGVIVLGIATVALLFKVKETNGIDLDKNDIL
jgi:MFS family permease